MHWFYSCPKVTLLVTQQGPRQVRVLGSDRAWEVGACQGVTQALC